MARARITLIASYEYEIEEQYYGDALTHEEMVGIDVDSYQYDYHEFLDNCFEFGEVRVSGIVLSEEGDK